MREDLYRNSTARTPERKSVRQMYPSITTDTSMNTGQTSSRRSTTQPTNSPKTQISPNAAQRLRTTMAAVKLAFTWLGVRKTLAPEQRTTAARAFHADRELLWASKLILDTKNPAYRAVAAVRSEASSYWRTVTLPFPEAGIPLLPQNSLGPFASTMQTYREAVPCRRTPRHIPWPQPVKSAILGGESAPPRPRARWSTMKNGPLSGAAARPLVQGLFTAA